MSAPVVQSFDLRGLIRETFRETGTVDPGALAVEVDRRVTDEELRAAFRASLRTFVRQVLSEDRMSATTLSSFVDAVSANRSAVRRSRATAMRNWYADLLATSVHVGRTEGGRERHLALGDCTVGDLSAMISAREEHARRNLAKARSYGELRDLLLERNVVRVRDLSEDDLRAWAA